MPADFGEAERFFIGATIVNNDLLRPALPRKKRRK